MFIGHYSAAFFIKRGESRISLGTLFIAVQLVDLIWPIMLLAGIESVRIAPGITEVTSLDFYHYPYTHSLLGVMFWGCIIGGIYLFRKRSLQGALIIAGAVLSHWLLDLVTHRPDLPLYPGSDIVMGFGLWNSPILTILIEGGLFTAAIFLYVHITRPINKKGIYGLWSLVVFLFVVWLINFFYHHLLMR